MEILETETADIMKERAKILSEFNNTKSDYPRDKTIHRLFEEQVERTPDNTAIVCGNKRLTYLELNQRADSLAAFLQEKGMSREAIAAILIEPSIEMFIGILAILKSGGAYLPIDIQYPAERIQYMLEDSGAGVLLTRSRLAQSITFGGQLIDLDEEELYEGTKMPLDIDCSEDLARSLAYIIYTSGSTGKPKGVMIEYRSLVNLCFWHNSRYNVSENDRSTKYAGTGFDASVWEIFPYLLAGAEIHIISDEIKLDPEKLNKYFMDNKITISFLPTQMCEQFMLLENKSLTRLLTGGDKLRRYTDKGYKLINNYGPTENTVVTTCFEVDRAYENIPIGKPIANTRIYIIDKDGSLAPIGCEGELCIAGDSLARGYLGRPELTAEKFVDNPFELGEKMYRTGDMAKWLPDGNIEFLGRVDYQIKIRGFRIEPGEIEARLMEYCDVRAAAVIAREDAAGNSFLCAYLTSGDTLDTKALKAHLAAVLPYYMIPARFVQLAEMPVNANGKIDRNALKELETDRKERGSTAQYAAPANAEEEKLANIWSEVLGIERLGTEDSFFELGGHSLSAASIAARIRREFSTELGVRDIFRMPTIKALAEYLKGKAKADMETVNTIKAVAQKEYYPAAPVQKRMYVLEQMEGVGTTYNLPMVFIIERRLDLRRVEAAFGALIKRHESLRTSFETISGEIVQKIHDSVDFKLERLQIEAGNIEEAIDKFVRPFILSEAPLLRAGIGALSEDKYLLIIDSHHIIADGSSYNILLEELAELYQGNDPAPLRIQYKEYCGWLEASDKDASAQNAMKRQEQYWLERLSDGALPQLNMPTDYMRPAVQSFEGDKLYFELDDDMTAKLRDMARETGTTLYMILLSVWNILLGRYSGQEDILVGTPVAVRANAETENIIGMFVNTLVMRNNPHGDKTYRKFLETVKENSLGAYENQEYEFERLIEKLQVPRNQGRNPIFDTMFVMQSMGMPKLKLGEQSFRQLEYRNKTAMFDMLLEAYEEEDGLRLNIQYCTRLFKEDTIKRLSGHFINIIREIIRTPEIKLSSIEILGEEERQKLLREFNDTQADYPSTKTLHEIFEEQAERTPDRIAAVFGDEALSYGQLNERADKLAARLREKGVKSDSIVGLMTERSLEMSIAIFAILKAGGAYLPIDPRYPADRIKYMLEDSKAEILLTREQYAEKADFSGEMLYIDHELSIAANCSKLQSINKPNDLAYVIYTSGSTGKPKGAMLEHTSAVNRLNWMQKKYPIGENDVILQKTPFTFDVSVWELFWWSFAGARVCFLEPEGEKDPEKIMEAIEKNNITTMHFVPSMLNTFLEYIEGRKDINRLASLKRVFASGEALTPKQVERFNNLLNKEHGIRLINLYGPTEATVDVTYFDCSVGQKPELVPIGKPIDNICLHILDKYGRPQPIGVPGELHIAGVGLARGYLNKPELTAEKFVANPFAAGERMYRTGDLVRWLPDGNIEFLGRIDHQVKIRGFRIELGEIESKLSKHELVKEVVVVDRPDDSGSKYLCAYIVPQKWETADKAPLSEALRKHIAEDLPDYMIPSYFIYIESMPLTTSGKIDRKLLPLPETGAVSGAAYEAPRNETEERLARLWSELLGIEKVGINDSFFDLGGHSLKAVSLAARIHKEFSAALGINHIFKMPTIKQQSEYIAAVEKTLYSDIKPIEEKEYYPASSAQKRMFIMQQFSPDSTNYNLPMVLLIEGCLDRAQVQQTFYKLIQRHESLRTSFDSMGEAIVQKVCKNVEFSLGCMEDREERLNEIMREFVRPFDLSCAPLMRAKLVKVSQDRHLLITDMHHIISDGVSLKVIMKEFAELYEGKELPKLRIQYKEYCAWQQSQDGQQSQEVQQSPIGRQLSDTRAKRMQSQEQYWLDVFRDDIPIPDIPTDYPRPGIKSFEGSYISFKLESELTAGLNELAKKTGTTMYMLLLAIYNILLSRYGKQEDIVVGSPVAGRNNVELENIVGMFINLLAMRNFPAGDKRFTDFLEEVKQNSLRAYEAQDYPFEELVEKLNLDRDLSRNPLFEASLALQNYDMDDIKTEKLNLRELKFEYNIAKFDMTIYAEEKNGEINCIFEYCTRLFKKETIEKLAGHFVNIAKEIVENPYQRLCEISMLSKEEKNRLVYELNATEHDYDSERTMHQLFEESAAKYPDNIAVIFEEQTLCYRDLNEKANKLARLLREKGIKEGDLVGILMNRSSEAVIGVMGVLKAGAAYVPFDPSFPRERIQKILLDLKVSCILTQTVHLAYIHSFQWELPELIDVICLDVDTPKPPVESIDSDTIVSLWDHVADRAVDKVTAGGFISSYTGQPFAEAEVDEYRDNIVRLAMPHVGKGKQVLEIGCGSGLIMYELAPHAEKYIGLDPSKLTQDRNREYVRKNQITNIELTEGFAHDIKAMKEGSFDLIIIASTVQFFPGLIYTEEIVRECVRLLKPDGILLMSDIMNRRKKEDFRTSLEEFKKLHAGEPGIKTKTDLESELYIDEDFFHDLYCEFTEIENMETLHRQTGFENELRFRYDIVIKKQGSDSVPRAKQHRHRNIWTVHHRSELSGDNLNIQISPDSRAYIIYTSGSTGVPKGVVIQHRPVINIIDWMNKTFEVGTRDRVLFVTSLCFDLSVYDMFGILAAGGSIHVVSKEGLRNPEYLVSMLSGGSITIWDSAPAALQLLAAYFPKDTELTKNTKLRLVFLSGDWIPVTLPDAVRETFAGSRIVSLGGATEATIWSNYYFIGEVGRDWPSIPYGKPIQNAKYYILDKNLNPCPVGVPGDLYIGGSCLAWGYANDPKLTAEKFIPNPFVKEPDARIYRTGDIARYFPDGNMEFLGRKDNQVKIRGYRIELGEIESQLRKLDSIKEAVVIDIQDESGNKSLCAYIVAGEQLTVAELREHLAKSLPDYMVPAYFVQLDKMPVTANGKLDRKALPEPDGNMNTGTEYEAPRDELEQRLSEIWQEALSIERIGINDNFFEIGGHSLKATGIVSRVHREFGTELTLSGLFKAPTIKELAQYIRESSGVQALDSEICAVEEREFYPASSGQKRIYITQSFAEDDTLYNMPMPIILEGKLDKEKLEMALTKLVERHESLRTSFEMHGKELMQKVHKEVDFKLEYTKTDERKLPRVVKNLMKPFDFAKAPIFRATLIELEPQKHMLLTETNHIVSDGVSMAILMRDFMELYAERTLPQLGLQYKDFAVWQTNLHNSERLKKQESYWLEKLAGERPILSLKSDYPKTAVPNMQGDEKVFQIGAELTEKIKNLGKNTGTTLYMLCLTAYNILLAKLSGQSDITVGSLTAGRQSAELENIIGMFVNTLPMRNYPEGEKSLGEFLEEVKVNSLEAFENQDYQYEELLRKLGMQSTSEAATLFNTMFSTMNIDMPQLELEGLKIAPYIQKSNISEYDLMMEAAESENTISFTIQYRIRLFKTETIQKIAESYIRILEEMTSNPDKKIKHIEI